jgi:dethiobiotin synthetase
MKRIFVTGIGTEIGKTFCSAIIVEAMKADYWKPVQAGELDQLDSDFVRHAISNDQTVVHPEQFLLSEPMSPHAAARIDGVRLSPAKFQVPKTENNLIIEGAGGLMVPLNDEGDMIVDLIPHLADEVILISKNYLGSINHTLLSIELLKARNIPIRGILFNGAPNPETEKVILEYTQVSCLGKIPLLDEDLKSFVVTQAKSIKLI